MCVNKDNQFKTSSGTVDKSETLISFFFLGILLTFLLKMDQRLQPRNVGAGHTSLPVPAVGMFRLLTDTERLG